MHVPHHGGNVGGNGGADVFPQYHGGGDGEGDPALKQHHQRYGGGGGGRLHDQGQCGTDDNEQNQRQVTVLAESVQERQQFRVAANIRYAVFDEFEADKQNTETYHGFGNVAPALVFGEQEGKEDTDQRHGDGGDLHLEAEQRNNPGGDGGTDVGAHDHAGGLHKAQQASVNKPDGHNRGGGG